MSGTLTVKTPPDKAFTVFFVPVLKTEVEGEAITQRPKSQETTSAPTAASDGRHY